MSVMELPLHELSEGKSIKARISNHPSVKWHHELGPYAGKEVEITSVRRLALGDFAVFKGGEVERQISARFITPILPTTP